MERVYFFHYTSIIILTTFCFHKKISQLVYAKILKNYCEYLTKMCGYFISNLEIKKGILYIKILKTSFFNAITFFNLHILTQVKNFIDLCIIDQIYDRERFDLHYILLSMFLNMRLVLHFSISPFESIRSLTFLFKSANWIEREAWDMFGIFFDNHPDLRKILTDYGFEGFPLRKDFPLSGYFEVRYDDGRKQVIYDNLELTQTLRHFNFINPWSYNNSSYIMSAV